MAEVAVPRQLFAAILERIQRLRPPAMGARMMETNGDNAGEPERDGNGLFASVPNALPKTIQRRITARWRADGTSREPETVLTKLGDRIE